MGEKDEQELECRYYLMCERSYEQGCDGYMGCYSYEPMPNVTELTRLANFCHKCVEFGAEHVSNGLSHSYYGDALRAIADGINRACGIPVKE